MVNLATANPSPTPLPEADRLITSLNERKTTWATLPQRERERYLHQCLDSVAAVAPHWAEQACLAKGIDPQSSLAGEEWLCGPAAVLLNLRLLLQALAADGQPPLKQRQRQDPDQTIAQVFPACWQDWLLWQNFQGEVWLEPGKPPHQGVPLPGGTPTGEVALVLGAGNISSIAAMDTLYQLFGLNRVVLLKLNPVNEYLGPILEQAFQPLVQAGFCQMVYGGADLGQFLCCHPAIAHIHVTGSHYTHQAIVSSQTTAQNRPIRSITSELGCVTPILVVPGLWTKADLTFQARHVASMVAHNASFNCAAAQVLVMAKGWPQREAFLTCLRQELSQTPPRLAYYPGAEQRYQAFLTRYPQAEILGSNQTQVPWTLIPDVPPQVGEYALTQEAFCGVLAEVSLEADSPEAFLTQAVPFVNNTLWGNLSCILLVDDRTRRQQRSSLEQAIAQLQYGAIGVNVWTGVIYSLPCLTWGAFPGNSLQEIQSGQGVVHNTSLFHYPQKSVLWAPFRIWPTPLWFSRHPNLLQTARYLTEFYHRFQTRHLLAVILAAIKG